MVSFINMPSRCRYAFFVMKCFVMSESSSERCLHNAVNAMFCFLQSLKPVNETCYVYMGAIISVEDIDLRVTRQEGPGYSYGRCQKPGAKLEDDGPEMG